VRLTRRELLAGAAASAVAGGAIYELVDRLGRTPSRASAASFPPEQHVLESVRVIRDDGIEVVVPPLHHRIVTARLHVDGDRPSLVSAQEELRRTLASIEDGLEPTPAGLRGTGAGGWCSCSSWSSWSHRWWRRSSFAGSCCDHSSGAWAR